MLSGHDYQVVESDKIDKITFLNEGRVSSISVWSWGIDLALFNEQGEHVKSSHHKKLNNVIKRAIKHLDGKKPVAN